MVIIGWHVPEIVWSEITTSSFTTKGTYMHTHIYTHTHVSPGDCLRKKVIIKQIVQYVKRSPPSVSECRVYSMKYLTAVSVPVDPAGTPGESGRPNVATPEPAFTRKASAWPW